MELPEFLQPSDEQEQKELAMFLSQVDALHKPVADKLSARFIFDFLEKMLKPVTSTVKGPSEVTIPEQLQEITENIAYEVTNSIINDFDLHNTTISVLNTMQEVSWESKAALMITTFVLTFGDNGLNLCEESKVSINEIQIFPNINDGYKHHLDGSDSLFSIIFQLIGFILEFENLPIAYMISKDPNVRSARTHLIVAIYWIIRIVVAASATHIMKLSSWGYEFDKAISSLWKLPLLWSKKLRDFYNEGHLKDILSRLQDLLKEVVDIEAYNNIKEIIEQKNHDDNLKVLSVLFSSTERDVRPLYDCIRKRKVHLDELKGAHVLLFISGLENIAPEVDETKLNEFIDSFDLKSKNEIECKIVWMPVVDEDHSLRRKEATKKFMLKPFLDWFYVTEKLNQVILKYYDHHQKNNFDGWNSIDEPSRISNEVKKLVKDDWKYKGDPIIVVLNPQGNVVSHNAIHLFYIWGIKAFPFTSKRELDLWSDRFVVPITFGPLRYGMGQIYDTLVNTGEWLFIYGGGSLEWIRSFTGMMRSVAHELGIPPNIFYVGRSHNQELTQSVKEENLSDCLSDQFYWWLFWKRIEGMIYSLAHTGNLDDWRIQELQMLLNYDKANVGWVTIHRYYFNYVDTFHGKLVLSTLKEFKLWKDKALRDGVYKGFISHYKELERKIFPFKCIEFPTASCLRSSSYYYGLP